MSRRRENQPSLDAAPKHAEPVPEAGAMGAGVSFDIAKIFGGGK